MQTSMNKPRPLIYCLPCKQRLSTEFENSRKYGRKLFLGGRSGRKLSMSNIYPVTARGKASLPKKYACLMQCWCPFTSQTCPAYFLSRQTRERSVQHKITESQNHPYRQFGILLWSALLYLMYGSLQSFCGERLSLADLTIGCQIDACLTF